MLWFKKKEVPLIDVVQTWEVRWTSRHGSFSTHTKPEVEVFTNEKDAEDFKRSLENAAKLLKYTEFYKLATIKK